MFILSQTYHDYHRYCYLNIAIILYSPRDISLKKIDVAYCGVKL
jgi:hypothetical protein